MLYKNLSGYLRKKYGKRLKKICIDGGFSCPNRDGKCGTGGCIFCGERGAGEHIDRALSIKETVRKALDGAGVDDGFIAYFQNFSNTYADADTLRERYDAALIDSRIKILAIGTRPDCITEEIAELIASYKTRSDVWVELGFQTANEKTAQLINRSYPRGVFEKTVRILEKFEIPTVVHLMIGLPGEGDAELSETADYLDRFNLFGIKIHSVYVMEGTRLAEMYERGEYTPITEEDYVRRAAYLISRTNPDTVIHRITGDPPKDALLAPTWCRDKHRVIERINETLSSTGESQGSRYKESASNFFSKMY